ncbi:hypothetical protein ROHU_027915 [Labeo rohita]|uniref:Uncharacterized protein n=1 Tax=Labeo rohita TaxID=84645 RepID=A0A498M7C7_LABRO|nr:hypothetical protein ROHU_027915 [Labeo rohita]
MSETAGRLQPTLADETRLTFLKVSVTSFSHTVSPASPELREALTLRSETEYQRCDLCSDSVKADGKFVTPESEDKPIKQSG